MKVTNMISNKGNPVANQFILTGKETHMVNGESVERYTEVFQSYKSIIAKRYYMVNKWFTELDNHYWDYSATTGKYRNQFLGEGIAETRKKIASGEYILADLN